MKIIQSLVLILILCSQVFTQDSKDDQIKFTPISHATFVIQTEEKTIFVDPVGDLDNFLNFPSPDMILITHTHGDHLNVELVNTLKKDNTIVIVPKAVHDELNHGEILNNGDKKTYNDVNVEAIPMYNISKDRLNFHKKGTGNGYVVTVNGKRIYISGDTEDIVEMRNLKDIDFAFICMNLPYTMTVEQAASAVLEMKPDVVFPYHYRGQGGFSDLDKFAELVSENKNIQVKILQWYN